MTVPARRGSTRLRLRRRERKQLPTDDGRMPLVEHLRELRYRLLIVVGTLAVGIVIAYALYPVLLADWFFGPYCSADIPRPAGSECQLISLGVADQFITRIRISAIAAVIASAPVWIYQAGAFISPGLHRHERRWAAAFGVLGLLLFIVGVAFAYVSIPRGLEFLLNQGQAGDSGGGEIVPFLDARRYVDFLTLTLTAFGVAFLFPVFVLFGHLVGVLPIERLVAWRRGVIFGVFVAAALITPTQDPVTFLFMAVPLIVLYELCILLARARRRLRRRRGVVEGDVDYDELDDEEASPLERSPVERSPVERSERADPVS